LKAADTPAHWQYVKDDDPLHGKVHDRFILDGVYLTPPRLATGNPSIVVECSAGKLEKNYFSTGVVVVKEPGMNVLLLEGRVDGKQTVFVTTSLSTSGQGVFFLPIYLRDILPAKQVIVGAYEYLGAQVVMLFDMPEPSAVMEKCGSDRMLKPRGKK
jgi:hypothetical protein